MKRKTSDGPEVREEAQYLLDGLTIKHVHDETGTPAFLIQHCYGLRGPDRRMNALLAIFPSQTMERSIETNFHENTEDRELPDTMTGDANPRSQFSQRNLAKENYYPKGIAFLQKVIFSDENDHFLLELATTGQAAFIVTGDKIY